ncbi:MAG: phosphoribosylglycinamide formyltransferase [Betaproteobacteria bacterium]|nr:phosphoribosylglycinamide formyltransferase [Betaproteobacteria bacterium]
MKSIVILISGRGSNMEAILQAALPLEIRAVIANRPDAAGLKTAAAAGIATQVVDHQHYPSREAFDAALAATIASYAPDYLVLAGFMRILGEGFVRRYPHRIINIHPSLLPAFPGLHTHRQALAAGVKLHGATVHIVTPQLDHGPIIAQAAVPVLADDTEATLAARVLQAEHRIYPMALRWLAEDRLQWGADDVIHLRGTGVMQPVFIAPQDAS